MSFKKKFSFVTYFLQGVCMGAADIVPGISGGTIAFLMGFYERLILSLKSFDKKAFTLLLERKGGLFLAHTDLKFLLSLVIGIIFSIALLAQGVDYVLNVPEYSSLLYSFFTGLVIASFLIVFRLITCFKGKEAIALFLGGLAAFILTTAPPLFKEEGPFYELPLKTAIEIPLQNVNISTGRIENISLKTLSLLYSKGLIEKKTVLYQKEILFLLEEVLADKKTNTLFFIDPWIIFAGMVGISAMLLPGISGSYLLNILGVYPVVIEAISDFMNGLKHAHFEQASFFVLFNLGVGILLGASSFSWVITYLLKKYHSLTLSLLSGFMVGALPSIWPFRRYFFYVNPAHLEKGARLCLQDPYCPSFSSGLFLQGCVALTCGFMLVLLVESVSKKMLRRKLK